MHACVCVRACVCACVCTHCVFLSLHVQIVCESDDWACSVFLSAIKQQGYDNLFHSLTAKMPANIVTKVDDIIPPPPPPPLKVLGAPSVYISYSRFKRTYQATSDLTHFCDMLLAHGISVVIDRYATLEMADNEPAWITRQITTADFVIVLLDSAYPLNLSMAAQQSISESLDGDGFRRASCESRLLQGDSYMGRRDFIVPVQFGSTFSTCISDVPALLRNKTRYRLPHRFCSNNEQFQLLLCRLLREELYKLVSSHYKTPPSKPLKLPAITSG